MVGDPPPETGPLDINPMLPTDSMTQAEWDAYVIEAVLTWRKRPFRFSNERKKE
jgi:hypothetical protein